MTLRLKPGGSAVCGCYTPDYCIPFGSADPAEKQIRVTFPGNRDWVEDPASGYPECGNPPCGTVGLPRCCNDDYYFYYAPVEGLYHDLDFVSASAPAAGTLDRLVFDGGMPLPSALSALGIRPFYGFGNAGLDWGTTYSEGFGGKAWAWFYLELRGPEDTPFTVKYVPCGVDFPACESTTSYCRLKVSAYQPDASIVAPGHSIFEDNYNFYTYHFAYDPENDIFRAAQSDTGGGFLGQLAGQGGPLLFSAGITP